MALLDTGLAGARNVIEVVRARLPDLRKSDRKVADLLLADPHRMLGATVAETAEWAEVSQPTVIRFCNAIGCDGYQDFKIRLAQSLALGLSRRPMPPSARPMAPRRWPPRSSTSP